MNKYNHLTLVEREKFFLWKAQGVSLREIGRRLGRSHTTLSREPKRNSRGIRGGEYIPCHAQMKAEKRGIRQRTKAPLKCPLIFLYVRKYLRPPYGWSPEVIAGTLRIAHPGYSIVHETIYQYIYARRVKSRGMHLEQYLILGRKKRMKQNGRSVQRHSKIPEAVSIDLRPQVVERRKQPGHWETDNVIGKQTDSSALSVTVERVTRITLMSKLKDRTAEVKTQAVVGRMAEFSDSFKKTITADNGAENTRHKILTRETGMDVYFCHPYHSWEKGTVENTNGRIRRYIPKGVSIDTVSEEYIAALEHKLNSTPRKCLKYKTPYEMMRKLRGTTT